ncbi:glyoxalase [Actinorhabdospora filicis]|uniref:Glyoxalase n=1 Tax=Actinorhabdospora filicis TaxID=1785913 RepID=A0A9W6WBN7_9ACTN|nr:glyoxalase [Actinorhabdospora filicis]
MQNIAFDCDDAYTVGSFWSAVFGLPLMDDDKPGDPVAVIRREGGNLYFERVPEAKTVKNRVHLCLQAGKNRDAECERMLALGATIVDDRRHLKEDGGWCVFADPEGNEFCVLGRAATS